MATRKVSRARKGADAPPSTVVKTAAVRHGAITRTLPSYTTYKRWSDQMKSGWEALEDPSR
jgi:hypothetical protein